MTRTLDSEDYCRSANQLARDVLRQAMRDYNAHVADLREERHRLRQRLVTDFDMSGWARSYSDRIEEINAELRKLRAES